MFQHVRPLLVLKNSPIYQLWLCDKCNNMASPVLIEQSQVFLTFLEN